MLQYSKVTNIFFAKNWLISGWGLFKKKPLTWALMVLIFTIFYMVAMNSIIGKAIAALLTPIFAGGIYVAANKSDNGEPIAIENLFTMFKDSQKLKQLLIIGAIGVAVVGLIYLVQNMAGSDYQMQYKSSTGFDRTSTPGGILTTFITWAWGLASLFSIPLVAIKNQMAIESLKSSLSASLTNLISLVIFSFFAFLLTLIGVIPFGLGLLVVLPVLFCASYFAFKTVYLEVNEQNSTSNSGVTLSSAPRAPTNVEASTLKTAEQTIEDKEDLRLPRGFELNYFDEYMQITRVWHGFKTYLILLVALTFNGVWITSGFVEILLGERELLLKLFALVFIVLGLGLLYLTIATWLNKTQIYVSKNNIEIKHQPIPWLGNKRIETNNIKQLFVKKVYRGSSNNNRRYTYNVAGITSENKQFKLISGLEYDYYARFIEKKIEDYLGIDDEEISDEFK